MDYENVVRDFARRTRVNLEIVEKSKNNFGHGYEITQLINSCLGLLILPQQRFMDSIPKTPIDQLEAEGWAIPKVTGHFPQVENLQQMIRYLRNAIAHFNLEFLSDSEGKIRCLRVWNCRSGKKTWQAELGLDELKSILDKFTDLLIEHGHT
ncbi:HEPN family nuclease [uncultured Halomonas sp.]|uniref:HEPN family nuclease n=1 Tax=uncultured Halomonas sp. TaxID=173971 RepID=UPI0034172286